MKQFSRNLLMLVAILSLALAGSLSAQTTKGTIAGVVTDPQGAVVAKATVTATSASIGEVRSSTTGANGEYRIEALTPGTYTVTIVAAGFAKTNVSDVVVRTSVVTPNNVQLAVASANETVEVQATSDAIQTESGELSKSIPATEVKDLPYSSLNPYSLAVTLPGVTTVAGRDDMTNGTSFSVNGLRPRANNFLIDGFDNNDNGIAGQAFQPNNTEAIQDVTVLTNSYAAEYGRGGGSVSNLSFRSGSNGLHAGFWEQYSGSRLNALTSEDSVNELTRPAQFVNNIFGFRVGGPVVKNKLFFFVTSQWNRYFGAAGAPQLKIPTESGISTLNLIANDASNPVAQSNAQLLLNALGNLRGNGFAGNVALGTHGTCVAPCNVEYGFFQRTDSGKNLNREWTGRVDYAGVNDSIYVRYTDNYGASSPDLFANGGALPYADTQQSGPSRIFGTMWAHTFSPKVINEMRVSLQQIDFTFGPTAATLANPMANLPTITVSGSITNFWGGYAQSLFPQGRGHKTIQLQDAVSITKGSHTMKLGADMAILLIRDVFPFNANGLMNVSGGGDCTAIGITAASGCTGLANYIDGYLGPTGSMSRSFGNQRQSVPTMQSAFYFQDSWKLKSNFTLDYGLRYEYQPPDASNVLRYPSVDPSMLATAPFPTRIEVQPDRNNFAPRFGFAYTPKFWKSIFGEDKTVFRGGYGMFYDTFFTNMSNNTAGASPNAVAYSVTTAVKPGRGPANPLNTLATVSPTVNPRSTITSVDSHIVNPITHQWNFNIQRELPSKMKAEIAYVGTRGERLFFNQQLNPYVYPSSSRLNPSYGSIVIRGNKGDSNYHGLQTTVTREVKNLVMRGSYTWSRSIDNGSEVFLTSGGATRWMNVLDPRSDRGPSAFNRTHRAAISYTYNVPFPSGKGVLSAVFGGWSTSGIISFQSGTPETIYIGGTDQNMDGEAFNDRPMLGNPRAAINYSEGCLYNPDPTPCSGVGYDDGSGTLTDWNTGAEGTPSDFRYIVLGGSNSGRNGNVTRNNFTYPGRQDWNMSVLKRFTMPYKEGHVLEFRADMFNTFNHPNLGVSGLDGDINSSTFLDINSTRRGGRSIVIWAKYSF